jgi:DNA-binding IclR family transcriptional regulator
LRLARVRETSFPVVSRLQPILEKLTEEIGETTHACLFSGAAMMTIAIAEPSRATRAFVDLTQLLPAYATASGLAYLSYTSERNLEETLPRLGIKQHTHHTVRSAAELRERIALVRTNGCAVSAQTMEDDVTGIAAPIFDWHGQVQATLSAACVAVRLTPELQSQIERAVLRASLKATQVMGGEPHPKFVKLLKEAV